MKVEVVYATAKQQKVIELTLSESSTVRDAVVQSALGDSYPEIELGKTPVGIFGEKVGYDTVLQHGDRVEIYRPLIVDPMEARRLRARKQAQ